MITMFVAGDDDVVAAFDSESGEEIWRYRISETYKGHDGSHDGPISTPLLTGSVSSTDALISMLDKLYLYTGNSWYRDRSEALASGASVTSHSIVAKDTADHPLFRE